MISGVSKTIDLEGNSDIALEAEESQQIGLLSRSSHDHDLERTETRSIQSKLDHEHTVSIRKKLRALAGYFICNIGLTIYNKAVLGSFPFPWLLTTLHAGASSIGCLIMLHFGVFNATKLNLRDTLVLMAFSFLFTINIAVSNISLAMVSVPVHQVVRATTPLFATFLYRTLYSRSFSTATYLSLIPIVCGVALTTYGDYSFSTLGLIMTILGVILAALKTIITNRVMTGSLALSFWEVLLRLSPLACLQSFVCAVLTGEFRSFYQLLQHDYLSSAVGSKSLTYLAIILIGNGTLAFLLNISSFSTNKTAGALTMTVCANIKQSMTIVLGIVLFNVHLSPLNVGGILITVSGGALYSIVELDSTRKR